MAYCTYANVASEFKSVTFSSSSPVTDSEVTQFIVEADAFIDGMIGLRYVTPISASASASIAIVKRLSAWLVAHRVKGILIVRTGNDAVSQQVSEGNLRDMAIAELKMIGKGQLLLSDSTLVDSENGISSFAVDEDLEHEFKSGEDQW